MNAKILSGNLFSISNVQSVKTTGVSMQLEFETSVELIFLALKFKKKKFTKIKVLEPTKPNVLQITCLIQHCGATSGWVSRWVDEVKKILILGTEIRKIKVSSLTETPEMQTALP